MAFKDLFKKKPIKIELVLPTLAINPQLNPLLTSKIDSLIEGLSKINSKATIETKVFPCNGATGNLKEVSAWARIFNKSNGENYVEIKCPRYKRNVVNVTDISKSKYDMCYCVDVGFEQKVLLEKDQEPSDQKLYKCPYAGKFE